VFGKFELPHMGCYLARHFVRGFFLCCGYFPELDEGLSWLTMNEMSQHQMVFFRLIRMSPSVLAHELRCRGVPDESCNFWALTCLGCEVSSLISQCDLPQGTDPLSAAVSNINKLRNFFKQDFAAPACDRKAFVEQARLKIKLRSGLLHRAKLIYSSAEDTFDEVRKLSCNSAAI